MSNFMLIISYIAVMNGKRQLFQMKTSDSVQVKAAYESVAKQGYPCAIHYSAGVGTTLCECANGWHMRDENGVAVAPLCAISDRFIQRDRLVLNTKYGPKDDKFWVQDVVRKPKTTVDEIVAFVGGKSIAIECHIPEIELASHGDLSAEAIAEAKQAEWNKVCNEGIVVDGIRYKLLGHGTNAGKLGHLIFVDEEHRDMVFEILKKVNDTWMTTPAKGIAYLTGLQNVRPKEWIDLPIQPEDFVFFKEIMESVPTDRADMVNGNVFKTLAKDGGRTNEFSKADGQIMVHVSEKKREQWIDKMIESGMGRRAARRHVDEQIEKLKISFSARTRNAALKFSAIWVDFHTEWKKETGTNMIKGRDIDDIVFIGDDSVRKTKVGGKGAAFQTEKEWCDAVRFDWKTGFKFQLGLLITEEHLKVKDLPYQFLQLLYGASDEVIEKIAKKLVGKIRELHTIDGLGKHMTREMKTLLKLVPKIGRHPVINERIRNVFYKLVDKAMSGRFLNGGIYGMMHGDPVYQLQSYMKQDGHDVEVTGCLKAGEICLIGDTTEDNAGEDVVAYRSPIATLGALKRMKTAMIDPAYADFFAETGPCLLFNVLDDAVTQLAGDYDGDHAGVCKDKDIFTAVSEAQEKFGAWLPISDPGSPEKSAFTIRGCEEYAKGLTEISPLGQTMIEQHKILNGIKTVWKDGVPVGRETFEPNPDAVLSEGDHALNQVDASKHGNTTGKKHWACEKQGKAGELAKCKIYRDLIRDTVGTVDREALLAIKPEPEELCKGVLNKVYRYLYYAADLKFDLYDLPEINGEWNDDVANEVLDELMSNPLDKSFRGINGLVRKGKYDVDLGFCPNEGLFNSLSRRSWKTWGMVSGSEDGDRRMSAKEFSQLVRKQGLAELRNFCEAFGKDLQDGYDVVLWQMFMYSVKNYGDSTRKIDGILLSDLWNTTLDVFSGMMIDEIGLKRELNLDTIDEDLEIDDDMDDDEE